MDRSPESKLLVDSDDDRVCFHIHLNRSANDVGSQEVAPLMLKRKFWNYVLVVASPLLYLFTAIRRPDLVYGWVLALAWIAAILWIVVDIKKTANHQ